MECSHIRGWIGSRREHFYVRNKARGSYNNRKQMPIYACLTRIKAKHMSLHYTMVFFVFLSNHECTLACHHSRLCPNKYWSPSEDIWNIIHRLFDFKTCFLPWAISTTIHTSNMGEIITGIFDGFHIESRFQEIPARKSDLQIYCANVIHT